MRLPAAPSSRLHPRRLHARHPRPHLPAPLRRKPLPGVKLRPRRRGRYRGRAPLPPPPRQRRDRRRRPSAIPHPLYRRVWQGPASTAAMPAVTGRSRYAGIRGSQASTGRWRPSSTALWQGRAPAHGSCCAAAATVSSDPAIPAAPQHASPQPTGSAWRRSAASCPAATDRQDLPRLRLEAGVQVNVGLAPPEPEQSCEPQQTQ